jgi:hypothetical protein
MPSGDWASCPLRKAPAGEWPLTALAMTIIKRKLDRNAAAVRIRAVWSRRPQAHGQNNFDMISADDGDTLLLAPEIWVILSDLPKLPVSCPAGKKTRLPVNEQGQSDVFHYG